jgi:hypothetical protein
MTVTPASIPPTADPPLERLAIAWTGLLAETAGRRRELIEATLVADLVFSEGRADAARLRAELRRNGDRELLIDEPVRIDRSCVAGWTSIDVFRGSERVLALSMGDPPRPIYVRSELPRLARLDGGRLDPPAVRAGEQEQ